MAKEYPKRKLTPGDIARDHFRYFKNYLQELVGSGNTVTGHLKMLKAVLREAHSSKIITEYPFEKYSQVAVDDFDFGGMENAILVY